MSHLNLYIEPTVYVFYKDIFSNFIGCNKAFAEIAGFHRISDIIGMTDFDMPWCDTEAAYYREKDQAVLDGNYLCNHVETQRLSSGRDCRILINKVPLIDAKNLLTGVIGSYVTIADPHYHGTKSTVLKNVSVTERQIECLVFLAKGYTAKKIASEMDVSAKTVQTHIEKLKLKLHCHTKNELLDIAWQSDLVKLRLMSLSHKEGR